MAKTGDSPKCECHGEPLDWNSDPRYVKGGTWCCSVRRRKRQREAYAALDGVTYNRTLLRHRRDKALARWRRREARRG